MGFPRDPFKPVYSIFFFGNFDPILVPYIHPSRKTQATFFVNDPAKALKPDTDYFERILKVSRGRSFRIHWLPITFFSGGE
jgi:hypothetical protein